MTVEVQNRVKSCKSDKAISFVGFCVDVKLGKIRFFLKCIKKVQHFVEFFGIMYIIIFNC